MKQSNSLTYSEIAESTKVEMYINSLTDYGLEEDVDLDFLTERFNAVKDEIDIVYADLTNEKRLDIVTKMVAAEFYAVLIKV